MSAPAVRDGRRVVWLPYASPAEAEQRLGGLPDSVRVACYRGEGPLPDSIAEVEFYVLPYTKGPELLDRVGEMTKLRVVQTLTAGVDDFQARVPAGVTLCNAAGVHDAATAEMAVALALASGRRVGEAARHQTTHVGGSCSAFFPRADRLLAAQLGRFATGEELENVIT